MAETFPERLGERSEYSPVTAAAFRRPSFALPTLIIHVKVGFTVFMKVRVMQLGNPFKAICFDAFGTLVEIKDKRRPYIELLKAIDEDARIALRNRLMRENLPLDACLEEFAPHMPQETVQSLKDNLARETASIALRPQIRELWEYLRAGGYKLAVCSNLAASYGPALLENLPGIPDAVILSYEIGHIKPEPEIYQRVCDVLHLPANAILFTGDTKAADVDGPKAFGMDALHIDELVARFEARSA